MPSNNLDALIQDLIRKGRERFDAPRGKVPFNTNLPDAEELLNDIAGHPHYFVLACVMDRQISAGKAWAIPFRVGKELGGSDFRTFRKAPLDRLKATFQKNCLTGKPLHRYPGNMAECFYRAVEKISDDYDGDASLIWQGKPSSALVIRRFLELKGVGIKIATMATNILARDFKVLLDDCLREIKMDGRTGKYPVDIPFLG